MEKIKVNMSPNPLDVQTIHASQNDGEARQWEFELHNNGELIDTSDVTEQMFFKAYKGGTEQLLPENTSTPTTSPFLGDIKYPQGLLTDQEFTYRQSPTESDGLAKITDIKGNTLVWNQLFEPRDNGSFSFNGVTVTVQDGKYTLSGTATSSGGRWARWNKSNIVFKKGHKYLYSIFVAMIYSYSSSGDFAGELSAGQRIFEPTEDMTVFLGFNAVNGTTYNQSGYIYIIDLTPMGYDSLTADQFRSLYPLNYYQYNSGELLSFNGNGIKTTGKNLLPLPIAETKNGITLTHNDDGSITLKGTATALIYFDFSTNFDSSKYAGCLFTCRRASQASVSGVLCRISQSNRVAIQDLYIGNETEVQDNGEGLYFAIRVADGTTMPTDGYTLYPMLRMPNQDSTFEPYTSSTLSLPISTYFPNGMKSAGSVYDELTESKAITRVGAVDLGSLKWTKEARQNRFNSKALADAKLFSSDSVANAICAKYITITADDTYFGNDGLSIDSGGRVNICDSAYASATASDFKTAMSGVYLYYELATPTETSFTTASLVTENAEIPLSNEDGVLIGKCTEQLSENPGFIDAKIKLSDSDGTCYSNKLQLHVERSPQ